MDIADVKVWRRGTIRWLDWSPKAQFGKRRMRRQPHGKMGRKKLQFANRHDLEPVPVVTEWRGVVGHSRPSVDGREEEREIGAWRKRKRCAAARTISDQISGRYEMPVFTSASDPTLHRRALNADAETVESAGKSRHANHTGSYVCRPSQTKGTVGIGIELAARLVESCPERPRGLIRWHGERAMIRSIL